MAEVACPSNCTVKRHKQDATKDVSTAKLLPFTKAASEQKCLGAPQASEPQVPAAGCVPASCPLPRGGPKHVGFMQE